MDVGSIIVSSLVRGLASGLPVGAEAQLLAIGLFLPDGADSAAIDWVAQLGSAGGLILAGGDDLAQLGRRALRRPDPDNTEPHLGLDWALPVSALLAAVGGFVLSGTAQLLAGVPRAVAGGLLLTALSLLALRRVGVTERPTSRLIAIAMGLAGAVSVLPGMSLMASLYVVGRFGGMSKTRALRVTIAAAGPVTLCRCLALNPNVPVWRTLGVGGLAVGLIVSVGAAFGATWLWRIADGGSEAERFLPYAIAPYLIALGLAFAAYGLALPG